jgi:cytochrome b561
MTAATARFSAKFATERYNPVSQALHWITAVLVLTTLPIAWVMTNVADDNKLVGPLFMIHKSLGVAIFLVVAFRILWRGLDPAPPLPWTMESWEAWSARISHFLLYLVLLGMPVSGYILSSASNHPVSFFGLFNLPLLTENKPLAKSAGEVHEALAYAVYFLVGLHIGATAYHLVVKRDGILNRMLPKQVNWAGDQRK